MANALWISAVGITLVFIGLILLWGLMALLVRLTSSNGSSIPPAPISNSSDHDQDRDEEKNQAAAIAVAAALAIKNRSLRKSQIEENGMMTPWQVAHRNHNLSQKGPLMRRKG